jgi:hypothetical protein
MDGAAGLSETRSGRSGLTAQIGHEPGIKINEE